MPPAQESLAGGEDETGLDFDTLAMPDHEDARPAATLTLEVSSQETPDQETRIELIDDSVFVDTGGERLPLTAVLESLLFAAGDPVTPLQLAKTLELPGDEIEQGLKHLAERYRNEGRGLRLQSHNGKYQLVTVPAVASHIETFLNLDISTKLSGPALETLAVIAYRQPVTRAQIEAVRGVDCAGVLRSLSQRGLVEEVGRLDAVGRPILYSVTDLFMQHFGLMELGELPPLEQVEADLLWATTALADSGADPGAEQAGKAEPDAADWEDAATE